MRVFKSVFTLSALLLAAASTARADPSPASPARCTSGVCCNLFTQTVHPLGKMCRPPCGDCDKPEFCDGKVSTCPDDVAQPAGMVCRPAVGPCDVEEKCQGGKNFYCPADALVQKDTVCRYKPANSECENDVKCDGLNPSCPPRSFVAPGTVCRPAGDTCNPAETCTGSSSYCPPDVKLNSCPCSEKTLSEDEKVCGVVQCNNGVCDKVPKPAGTLCRAGDLLKCTEDTFCTGKDLTCPTSKRVLQGTICRHSKGICDTPEVCPVSGNCPDDLAVKDKVCREAAGDCDEADKCDYNPSAAKPNPNCPADVKKSSSTICRPRITFCDIQEKCDGKSNTCPPDIYQGAGTNCNVNDASISATPKPYTLENECDAPDTCSGNTPFCVDNRYDCYQPDSSGGASYTTLLEAEVTGDSIPFHPIAIVARPAGEQAKASSVSSSGSHFRSVGRRD